MSALRPDLPQASNFGRRVFLQQTAAASVLSIRSIGANGRTPLSGDGFNEAKVLAKLLPTRGGRHANPHWFALEPDCYFPGRASPAISLQNQGILPTLLMQNCNEKPTDACQWRS